MRPAEMQREIERLKRRESQLVDEIRTLKAQMAESYRFPPDWRLTRLEARIVNVLLAKRVATTEAIMIGCYSARAEDIPHEPVIKTHVHKLRKKLAPFGISIETQWGIGYFLTDDVRARIQAACK